MRLSTDRRGPIRTLVDRWSTKTNSDNCSSVAGALKRSPSPTVQVPGRLADQLVEVVAADGAGEGRAELAAEQPSRVLHVLIRAVELERAVALAKRRTDDDEG